MIFSKNRRAAIGIQFNWVFVLIAGGIFLVMITSVIMTQKSSSNQEISAKLIQKLNSYFKIEQESNVFREIKTYQTNIDFRCTEEGVSDYRTSFGISQQTPVEPIFAPGTLRGQTLYLWTMDWKAPFKIMSFSLVSNPRTVFYFYNDTDNKDIVRKIINEFPKNLSRNISYKAGKNPDIDLKETNYDNYKVIYLNYEPGSNINYPYIKITIENNIEGYGIINFDEEESYFLGKASLYGAIFSTDKESYNCNMEKAFKRYNILSNLMLNRTKELKSDYPPYNLCFDNYENAVSNLEIINRTTSLSFNEITEDSIEELYAAVNSLERTNNYLALRGCPVLY